MLVLSRKHGQIVTIGDQIEVVILEINGRQVRLGITAPKEVVVHRKEIYEEIKREQDGQK